MRLYLRGKIYWADLRYAGLGRVTTGKRDLKQAHAAASRLLQGIGIRQTLGDALTKAWQEHYRDTKGSRNVHSQMQRLTGWHGKVLLADITTPVLGRWTQELKASGNSNKTVNRYLAVISKVLGMACLWGWIDERPLIPRLPEGRGRIRTITCDEYEALSSALSDGGSWALPLVDFLLDTGCRLGEALSIPHSDRLQAIETGKWTIWVNKGDRPRTIPLTTRATKALIEYSWEGASPRQCQRVWARARRVMGLQDDGQFVIHALRHTCATRLVNEGHLLTDVQAWLGHSSVTVTEKYAHMDTGRLQALADTLDAPAGVRHDPLYISNGHTQSVYNQ